MRIWILLGLFCIAALPAACGPHEDNDGSETPTPTATPLPANVSLYADVIPALASCAPAGCHDATIEQGGLSLDEPATSCYDVYEEIHIETRYDTNYGTGPRVSAFDPDDPAASFFLQKAIGNYGHAGGASLTEGQYDYQVVSTWIAEGLINDCP